MIPRFRPAEIESIRAACAVVHSVRIALEAAIAPGVSTLELDRLAEQTIRAAGGEPAFKGYRGFPASICASLNAEAVHGFPRPAPLRAGDLLCVDVGVLLDGWYGDGAFTVAVGPVAPAVERLLAATGAALDNGIDAARVGNRFSDISHAVESAAAAAGVSVVRQYGGHGIGRQLHGEPHIPNCGRPGRGPRIEEGFVFTIEPIFSLGAPEVRVAADGWTTVTCDGSPAAHFEHTVAVTGQGPTILTRPATAPALGAAA